MTTKTQGGNLMAQKTVQKKKRVLATGLSIMKPRDYVSDLPWCKDHKIFPIRQSPISPVSEKHLKTMEQ